MKTFGIALLTLIFSSATVAQTPSKTAQTPSKTGQQPAPQKNASPGSDQQTLRVNTTLVNTVFTVADRNGKGKFITNLKKEDFKVYEDDKPQPITNFSTET